MVDWPISHYPDDMQPIRTRAEGCAYITDVYDGNLYGRLDQGSLVWSIKSGKCVTSGYDSAYDLIPPTRDVERWFVWDHENIAENANPIMRYTEAATDRFIKLYNGTKVKVIIPYLGEDNG